MTRCLQQGELPEGEIIELGTWLGAMSFVIGTALRDSGRPGARFHAYDTFRLDGHATELGGACHDDGDVVTPDTAAIDLEVNRFLSALSSRLGHRLAVIDDLASVADRTHRARCDATDRHPVRAWRESRTVRDAARVARDTGQLWQAR